MCSCTQYGRYQYVLSDRLHYLNMVVKWHWRYLMSAHSSMAASIDLPTLQVLALCLAAFRFLFDVYRNSCINERDCIKMRSDLCYWFTHNTRCDKDLCPSLWSSAAVCVGVRVFICVIIQTRSHASAWLYLCVCEISEASIKSLRTTLSAIGALLCTHRAQAQSPEHLLWSCFSLSCQDSNRCLT